MLKITFIQFFLGLFFALAIFISLIISRQNDRVLVYQKEDIECIDLLGDATHVQALQIIGVKELNNPRVLHYALSSNERIIGRIASYMQSKLLIRSGDINFKSTKAPYKVKIIKKSSGSCQLDICLTDRGEGIISIAGKDSAYRCDKAVFLVDSIFKKSPLNVYDAN